MGRCALVALVAVLVAGVSPVAAEVVERLLAVVSGQLIMASDVTAARRLGLVPDGGTNREALDRLIDRALILAEVERYAPPEPSEAAIAADLARLRARFADATAFDGVLAATGFDEGMIRERIRQDLRIEAYLDQRFVVAVPTQDEIEAAYRAEPERFAGGGARTLEEARPQVVRVLMEERRAPRVAEWIAGLRRRSRAVILVEQDPRATIND